MNFGINFASAADWLIDKLDNPVKGTSFAEKALAFAVVGVVVLVGMLSQPAAAQTVELSSSNCGYHCVVGPEVPTVSPATQVRWSVNRQAIVETGSAQYMVSAMEPVRIELSSIGPDSECYLRVGRDALFVSDMTSSRIVLVSPEAQINSYVVTVDTQVVGAGRGLCVTTPQVKLDFTCGTKKFFIHLNTIDPSCIK